jgi:hypothetical protein
MKKYFLFVAVCFLPAICFAQPGSGGSGICMDESQYTCAEMGSGYQGPCNATDCAGLEGYRYCPKDEGLTVAVPDTTKYWDVRPAETNVQGSTIVIPLNPPNECGSIYECECLFDWEKCRDKPGGRLRGFVPSEFRIGVINCTG